MLRRVFGLFAILLIPSACLSDHCAVYPDHCVEIAGSSESTDAEATSGSLTGSESTDTGDPSDIPDLPNGPDEAPTLELRFSPIKQFEFSWSPVLGATHYRLFESPNVDEPFVQIGGDLDGDAVAIAMPLHFRVNASYKLLACDAAACMESPVVDVVGNLAEAVGYFKADAPDESDLFGASVALSNDGSTLVVGAAGDDNASGAVYVFVRGEGGWTQQARLEASNRDPDDSFGAKLALANDGDILAVTAPSEDSKAVGVDGNQEDDSAPDAGAVYVFVRNGQDWSQQAYVKASNTDDKDFFGTSVALSGEGDVLAVGAREHDDIGAVHLFARNGSQWSSQVRLQASNADDHDRFGASVALASDGTTLAVGAPFENSNATGIDGDPSNDAADNAGAAYVFVRVNGSWWSQAYIKASNTSAHDYFGSSVALSGTGDGLAVGAPGQDEFTGAAHVFVRNEGVWSQQAYVQASNADPGDGFGESVALAEEGDVLAIGARHEMSHANGVGEEPSDNSTSSAGAVYVLVRSGDTWSAKARVKASNTGHEDYFGVSVALSSDGATLAVGARGEAGGAAGIGGDQTDDSVPDAGAVYLY